MYHGTSAMYHMSSYTMVHCIWNFMRTWLYVNNDNSPSVVYGMFSIQCTMVHRQCTMVHCRCTMVHLLMDNHAFSTVTDIKTNLWCSGFFHLVTLKLSFTEAFIWTHIVCRHCFTFDASIFKQTKEVVAILLF